MVSRPPNETHPGETCPGETCPGETRWWLIRHAPVTDPPGVILGQLDAPANLSDTGALAARAATLPSDAVWLSSPLRRCHDTARALAPPGHRIATDADLREQHFGDWQGLNHTAVAAQWGAAAAAFWQAPMTTAPPGGEAFTAMAARVKAALERLSAAHAGRDVVAVVHDGTIRAALFTALGSEPEGTKAFKIDNLSLTRLDHLTLAGGSTAWRIAGVNWGVRPAAAPPPPASPPAGTSG